MAMSGLPPFAQPSLGKGNTSNFRMELLAEQATAESGQKRLANKAVASRGVHKLMRSGTRTGKFVKFLYRLIWDFTYK